MKKALVYAAMLAAFAGVMWLIFAPAADREVAGFNADIPDPRGAVIVASKKAAYERSTEREERQLAMGHKPQEFYDNPERFERAESFERADAIHSSAAAHSELTGTLGTFFEEPDPEKEAMAAEIERLNDALASQQPAEMSVDDQLALLERSYQLAAQYGEPAPVQPIETAPKARVEPVTQIKREVVSRLIAPISDTSKTAKNTIAAAVHGDQTVIDGQAVRLRTVEPMRVGRHTIPQGAVITGVGTLSGERLQIVVTAIEHAGDIVPVELTVCDLDGQDGIHVPGSMELDAFKEIAGNMGQGLGTTINLNRQSAGGQLLADLGRGVIQGTSQYVSRKARQVKVRLKSGHRLYLLPKTE